jgi:hypothetical protein
MDLEEVLGLECLSSCGDACPGARNADRIDDIRAGSRKSGTRLYTEPS